MCVCVCDGVCVCVCVWVCIRIQVIRVCGGGGWNPHNFLGCGSPLLFSFQLPICYTRPIYIYICIVCVPTRNRNNEFIL